LGVFFDTPPAARRNTMKTAIAHALETDPQTVPDIDVEAERRASEAVDPPAGYAKFNAGRFGGALLIFAAIVGSAIGADAAGLNDSSKALYGFAATVFGVVVGFLGGEKTASP
jgi:hypothetical protein